MKPALPLILVVDNVRSLYNVGALFRTADGVGVKEVILCGLTPQPPRHEIEKTALGALITTPWRYVASTPQALEHLKGLGYTLCALEQTPHSENLYTFTPRAPLALVVGHEREGVSPEALALCEKQVEIPMAGRSVHSLNVGVAAGIALYEMSRKLCYDKESTNSLLCTSLSVEQTEK